MRRIFISYTSNDEHYARQLIAALRGVQTFGFMDNADFAHGQPISNVIRESIRSADAMVVLLSPFIRTTRWVVFELGVAQGMGKKIVPILIPGARFEDSLPDVLAGVQVLDARHMPVAEVANRLSAIV
jgi:hypothetical protein